MELTKSYEKAVSSRIVARYSWLEVRNAAAIIAASDNRTHLEMHFVLSRFNLSVPYLLDAGGGKSKLAADLDEAFRELGWRETHMSIETVTKLEKQPWRKGGEKKVETETVPMAGDTHKLDNVQRRVAIDVEWHAKDGNLDRDLSAFRALYDAGVIDAGVLITRSYADVYHLSNWLGKHLGRPHLDRKGNEIPRFRTTTTTTMEKLEFRLRRGDAGGCPVLAVGIGYRTYTPGLIYVDPDGVERQAPVVPELNSEQYKELVQVAVSDDDESDPA